jgi:hypothetical protein
MLSLHCYIVTLQNSLDKMIFSVCHPFSQNSTNPFKNPTDPVKKLTMT